MNRNKERQKANIMNICQAFKEINSQEEIYHFLAEILTDAEIETLSKRWQILKMLYDGTPQREIAKELHVSLCKITRGASILKKQNSVTKKFLIKEIKNVK